MTQLLDPLRERRARAVTAYRITSRAYFHLPVVVVFLDRAGFGVLLIAGFLAVYGLVVALGDAVVGPLRRVLSLSLPGSLFVGELVKAAGLVVLLAPLSTGSVLVSQVLSGLGFCLTAGTDSALASSMREGERYRAQESRTQMGMFMISFAAGVTGALAFVLHERLPFVLSALAALVSAAVVVSLRSSLRTRSPERPAASGASSQNAGGAALTVRVRFWSSYYSLSRAVLLSVYTFLLPILLLFELDLPVAAFGAVLGLYTLFGLVAARLSLRLTRRPENRSAFAVTAVATVLGLGLLGLGVPWLVAAAIPLLGLAGGLIRPATMMFLQPALAELPVDARQQVLRGLERKQGLLQCGLLLLTGLYLDRGQPVDGAFLGFAATALVLSLIAAGLAKDRERTPEAAPADLQSPPSTKGSR